MDIEVFVLCDAATSDAAGKLNLLGAFDTIATKQFPTQTQFAVACRVRFRFSERGSHNIKIQIVDSDGKEILPTFNADFVINIAQTQMTASHNIILSIGQLKIEKEGEYSINLAMDGKHISDKPFFVRKITA